MTPIATSAKTSASNRIWVVALAVAGAFYTATMAPGLLWGDSGEAQLHVLLGGWYINGEIARSHVLYYAIARFFSWALRLEAASAANLVSALAGAVTIANIAWLNTCLCRTIAAAAAATIMLLVSHTLWRLSASAEVVTLTTALLSAEWICFIQLVRTRRLGWLAGLCFLNGLGVSNHNFALLMWPVYMVIGLQWWSAFPRPRRWAVSIAAASLLLGMAPVLALCVDDWLTHRSIPATLESFLVGQYGRHVMNFTRLPSLFLRSAAMTAMNFPTPLLLLAPFGLFLLFRRTPRPIAWLLVGATIVYTAFGARYDVVDQHTFLVPAFLLVTVFAEIGIDAVFTRARGRPLRLVVFFLAAWGPLVYAVGPPLLKSYAPDIGLMPKRAVPHRDRFEWFLRPWLMGYHGAEQYAREVLQVLPPDAWLVVDGTLCPPLNHLQVSQNFRRDVRLDSWVERQDWFDPLRDDTARQEKIAAGLLFAASDDRQYLPDWLLAPTYRFEPFGHVFRVYCSTE